MRSGAKATRAAAVIRAWRSLLPWLHLTCVRLVDGMGLLEFPIARWCIDVWWQRGYRTRSRVEDLTKGETAR